MEIDEKTNDLISSLANNLKPVKPWAAPAGMALRYVVISAALIILGLLMSGPRPDFAIKSLQLNFWVGVALWMVFGFLGLAMIFTLATPGRKLSHGVLILFYLNLAGIFIWHLLRLIGMDAGGMTGGLSIEGSRCAFITTLTAVTLGTLVVYRAKRGASRRPRMTSVVIGLASLAVGGILITFNCGEDNGMHVLTWHFIVPGIITIGLAAAIASKLLRW